VALPVVVDVPGGTGVRLLAAGMRSGSHSIMNKTVLFFGTDTSLANLTPVLFTFKFFCNLSGIYF
jgi:hypothetical protein